MGGSCHNMYADIRTSHFKMPRVESSCKIYMHTRVFWHAMYTLVCAGYNVSNMFTTCHTDFLFLFVKMVLMALKNEEMAIFIATQL